MTSIALIILFVASILAGVYHNSVPLVLAGGFLLLGFTNLLNAGSSMIVFTGRKEGGK